MNIPPDTLLQNRYKIVRLLGQGGMGAVYKALDQQTGSTIALKQSLASDPSLRKAFEREARILTRLRHPSLPIVSNYFAQENGQFLVMQFIPGDDLGTLLERKKTMFLKESAVPWIMQWAMQLLDALTYLHTQQPPILHRDIKPQNLKLTRDGTIMLLDFGMAKSAGDQTRQSIVQSVRGYTTQYASLEQIQGLGTQPASDIYALAATMYHLFTGKAPPDALTRLAAMLEGSEDPLRSAHELNPNVPPVLALILHQALSQKISDRFTTASAMRKALKLAHKSTPTTTSNQQHTNDSAQSDTTTPETMVAPHPGTSTSSLPGVVDVQFDTGGMQTVISSPTKTSEQTSIPTSLEDITLSPITDKLQATPQTTHLTDTCTLCSTYVVDQKGGGNYTTISEAIAHANPGSRIFVRPGLYAEGILLDKPLEIIGDGPRETIIIESIGLKCLQMKTEYALLRGLTLRERAGPVAVDIPQGRLTMEHCDISSDTPVCIVVHNAETRPVFYQCKIHASAGIGMFFFKHSQGIVEECTIAQHELAGIKIAQQSNPLIRRCTIQHNKCTGVHVCDSGEGIIEGCDILANDYAGLEISSKGNPFVRNCTIREQMRGVGILVYDEGEGIIDTCEISKNSQASIQISRHGHPLIRHCKIYGGHGQEIVVDKYGRGVLEACHILNTSGDTVFVEHDQLLTVRQCHIHNEAHGMVKVWDNSTQPDKPGQQQTTLHASQRAPASVWQPGQAALYHRSQ
jgi:parallel beta-helix repeat protein